MYTLENIPGIFRYMEIFENKQETTTTEEIEGIERIEGIEKIEGKTRHNTRENIEIETLKNKNTKYNTRETPNISNQSKKIEQLG